MHPKQAGMLTIIAVVSKLNIETILVIAKKQQKNKFKICRICGSFVTCLWCLEKSTNGNAVVVIPCLLPTKYAWGLAT